MTVTVVSTVSGSGATLAMGAVTAGNTLFLIDAYFRGASTGVGEAAPTDTAGTFTTAIAPVPAIQTGFDVGVGIFYQPNASSGSHTVTPQANSSHQTTLVEVAGLVTSAVFVAGSAASALNSTFSGTSIGTGTTATAATAGDISFIVNCLAAIVGTSNVGYTDPVASYTTMHKAVDDATSVAALKSYRVLAAGGTQSAVFNWTDNEPQQFTQAAIATFVASTGAAATYVPYRSPYVQILAQ